MVTIVPAGAPPAEVLRPVAARTVRKIALCGSHSSSLVDAPWNDPSWEFWGHASSRAWYKRSMDRYFDLHPKACWTRGGKKTAAYPKWLAKNTVPIFMQKQFVEVPASRAYPKGQILAEFGNARPYFTNHVAWMIALALTEGVTTLGLFGINYSSESEYMMQRGSAEFWLGRAVERGVRLVIPEQCSLLQEPNLLYGYESHDEVTGLLKPEYKRKEFDRRSEKKVFTPGDNPTLAKPPAALVELIRQEEEDYPRPEWAIGPVERTDGGISGSAETV